jgi:uncharacterized protein YecE (DUF72 family)
MDESALSVDKSFVSVNLIDVRQIVDSQCETCATHRYSRDDVKKHAQTIKTAASTPEVQKAFAFYNNHSRANAPANAIMLSQELGVRLKGTPPEAMVTKFLELMQISASILRPVF